MKPEKQIKVKGPEGSQYIEACPGHVDLIYLEEERIKKLIVDVRLKLCATCVGKIMLGIDLPNQEIIDLYKTNQT